MNKVVIFGNNSFSELIAEYIAEFSESSVAAYMVNKEYIVEPCIRGIEVVPYEELENKFGKNEVKIIVTSGYKEMNNLRKKITLEITKKGYRLFSFIHPNSTIYADKVDGGNIVLEGAILSKHVRLGIGNIVWNNVNISHHTSVGDFNFFAPSAVIGGQCNIFNNCFFGLNSTVKGGINVSSYTLVGAGAYLGKDTAESEVYVYGSRDRLEGKNSLEML